jgi:hypothetical protein
VSDTVAVVSGSVLQPCPFCGRKKPKLIHDGANYWKGVECKCSLNIYFFHGKGDKKGHNVGCGNMQAVIDRWNQRAS